MAKILVVDSGSTKTDWAFILNDKIEIFTSQGINPSSDLVILDLNEYHTSILDNIREIEEIYYYGAGVTDDTTKNKVINWLRSYITHDVKITVESDLLGACKSLAGDSKGIISILGTGSNSCVYDGKNVIDNIPSLGYLLSNEGAGTEIGKAILKAYFYNKMPIDVRAEFEMTYQINKSSVIREIYLGDAPVSYIASYSKFINKTKNKKWRYAILRPLLQEFIELRIKSYIDFSSYELYFVGSIAYFCRDVLKDILEKDNLHAVKIIKKPIDGLIEYHKNKI